jgi:hypothetical protein
MHNLETSQLRINALLQPVGKDLLDSVDVTILKHDERTRRNRYLALATHLLQFMR